jgi:hypothetical protein
MQADRGCSNLSGLDSDSPETWTRKHLLFSDTAACSGPFLLSPKKLARTASKTGRAGSGSLRAYKEGSALTDSNATKTAVFASLNVNEKRDDVVYSDHDCGAGCSPFCWVLFRP